MSRANSTRVVSPINPREPAAIRQRVMLIPFDGAAPRKSPQQQLLILSAHQPGTRVDFVNHQR